VFFQPSDYASHAFFSEPMENEGSGNQDSESTQKVQQIYVIAPSLQLLQSVSY